MLINRFRRLTYLWLAGFLLVGCSKSSSSTSGGGGPTVVQKGQRVLGMDTSDPAADFTFNQTYAAAQGIGVKVSSLHFQWNQDEGAGSGATSGSFTDSGSVLADSNAFYPNTSPVGWVEMTVDPINTTTYNLPSDLGTGPMDNANVITRFNAFLDWVFTKLPSVTLYCIQIGNEIDTLTNAQNASYWSQYKTFLNSVVAHIHSVKPGIKVGVTVTLPGLIGKSGTTIQNGILSLLSVVDELGLTYYPVDNTTMTMENPSIVATDMASVFALVPSTPIYFMEVGYATASSIGGSAANQATFVDQIFSMWDAQVLQVPFVSFLRMNDYSATNAQNLANQIGLGGNANFVAYLQTLGFRTYPATSGFKSPSWSELQNQTHIRGWW